jgi:hypothetical protein
MAGSPGEAGPISAEVRWAPRQASPDVRAALRRLPRPMRAGGFLGDAITELDARLREP